jgi:hypothetical protein
MSSKARGFDADGLAEPANPNRLVELALDDDRVSADLWAASKRSASDAMLAWASARECHPAGA